MFDFSSMQDKRVPADELVKGDLVVIHNPFILNNKNSRSDMFYGPGVVLGLRKGSEHGPKDAIEIDVMFSDEEIKVSTFWGTLWHFYKM